MKQKNSPKISKNNTILKIFLCTELAVIFCLVFTIVIIKNTKNNNTGLTGELVYEYEDRSIPGGEYKVNLDYATGHIQIIETRFCSAGDCPPTPTITEYNGNLTIDELKKIRTLTSRGEYDLGHLTGVLRSLAEGGIFKSKSELEKNHEEEYWLKLYAEYDIDGDDVVTNREFGNVWLDYVLEER